MSVGGAAWAVARGAPGGELRLSLARCLHLRRRRIARDEPGLAIDEHVLPVGERERAGARRDRGDAELLGEDRRVAGRAAALGHDREHHGRIERGRVGGREVVGDEHERMAGRRECPASARPAGDR